MRESWEFKQERGRLDGLTSQTAGKEDEYGFCVKLVLDFIEFRPQSKDHTIKEV